MVRKVAFRMGTIHEQMREQLTHITKELGAARSCHCGVSTPEYGAVFVVTEPMETCHTSGGVGLDENNCLPPGVYRVLQNEVNQGGSSHVMHVEEVSAGARLMFFAGYEGGNYYPRDSMDWRHITKAPES